MYNFAHSYTETPPSVFRYHKNFRDGKIVFFTLLFQFYYVKKHFCATYINRHLKK